VNAVSGASFELNIVPHTLEETTLAGYRVGRQVNLEVDLIARYLERLLLGDAAAQPGAGSGLTRELLESHGFGSSRN
jgi:riboflavin synthase